MKKIWLLTMLALAGWLSVDCVVKAGEDKLYETFREQPGADARPYVYWWWQHNDVCQPEIVRQLDVMHQAGIGGALIVPIGNQQGDLQWLGPDWWRMVRFAADEAKKRGMGIDVSAAYAWPSGGSFVRPEHRLQTIACVSEEITGPRKYRKSVSAFLGKQFIGERKLVFARLVPKKLARLDQVIDLMGNVHDGTLSFSAPKENYVLYVGIQRTGARITHAGKGHFVLDYFNPHAVKTYLDYFSTTSRDALGGRLGNAIHAFYVDSIEIWPANWTTGLAEEFHKRRGYDLMPYLEFATGLYPVSQSPDSKTRLDLFTASPELADRIRRVRYDYTKTLVELFHDNFAEPVQQWCQEQGVRCRFQAYGHPWHIGMAENYMVPDLPEANSWLRNDQGWDIWNKYASTAGHLTGRHQIACEAMTDVKGIFRESLDEVKRADDFNFITGITGSTLHGYCYSPASEPPPGRSQFGTFFSEHNTWWPYFPRWTQYNTRLSKLFQSADPVTDVAILCPTADVWSNFGLNRGLLQSTPPYGYRLWQSLSQQGVSADYLHEAVLQKANFADGLLKFGPMNYRLLILCDMESLEPETAEAMDRYVKAGGKLVVIGQRPSRSPSLTDAAAKDQRVKKALDNAVREGGQVISIPAPEKDTNLLAWAGGLLDRAHIDRHVKFSAPSDKLFQVHYRNGNRDLFFLCNQDTQRLACSMAKFATGSKTAWRWDAETGERAIYPLDASGHLPIRLRPSESLLLVFEPDLREGPTYQLPLTAGKQAHTINAKWNLKLRDFRGKDMAISDQPLVDFTTSSTLQDFAGVADYEATFEVAPDNLATWAVLDLGKINGVSEVWLNGQHLGARWYSAHQYPVVDLLKPGANQLRVKVTTVLLNGVRELKRGGDSAGPRESAGMPGPVLLRDCLEANR